MLASSAFRSLLAVEHFSSPKYLCSFHSATKSKSGRCNAAVDDDDGDVMVTGVQGDGEEQEEFGEGLSQVRGEEVREEFREKPWHAECPAFSFNFPRDVFSHSWAEAG